MEEDDQGATTLGEYVRQARERSALSLRNVEQMTGIPRATLSRLENGQVDNPAPRMLHKIADALVLDVSDLFAFVGVTSSEELPNLTPYLRAKYDLPPEALAEAHKSIGQILAKYDQNADGTD